MDQIRFDRALSLVTDNIREGNSIGTLSEKTIHAVLKHYYAPDILYHEKRVEGFIADIFNGNEIIEIQTRNFNTLRRKLDAFLPKYPVTIVYPVAHTKWLRWINPENGEISSKRKSPKTGTPNQIFRELYRIKMYLPNPNLRFTIALLDVEEYRMLDGYGKNKKKGSSRNDGIPIAFSGEVSIESVKDYLQFLPFELPEKFTVKDYKSLSKIPQRDAQIALHIFNCLGIIRQIGKQGRSFLYEVIYT